jgi:hypothetical protein
MSERPGKTVLPCSIAPDEAALILVRFYFVTSRQSGWTGYFSSRRFRIEIRKTGPDFTFMLLPIAILVNGTIG